MIGGLVKLNSVNALFLTMLYLVSISFTIQGSVIDEDFNEIFDASHAMADTDVLVIQSTTDRVGINDVIQDGDEFISCGWLQGNYTVGNVSLESPLRTSSNYHKAGLILRVSNKGTPISGFLIESDQTSVELTHCTINQFGDMAIVAKPANGLFYHNNTRYLGWSMFIKMNSSYNISSVIAISGDVKSMVTHSDGFIFGGDFTRNQQFGNYTLFNLGFESGFIAHLGSDEIWKWAERIGGNTSSDRVNGVAWDGGDIVGITGAFCLFTYNECTLEHDNQTFNNDGFGDMFVTTYNLSSNSWGWTKEFDSNSMVLGTSITYDGVNFYSSFVYADVLRLDGSSYPNNGGGDIGLAKFDSNGNVIWVFTAGGPGGEMIWDMVASNGTIYLAGYHCGEIQTCAYTIGNKSHVGNGDYDILVLSVDVNGSILNSFSAGGVFLDQASDLFVGDDGILYVSGHFVDSANFSGSTYGSSDYRTRGFIWKFEDDFDADGTADTVDNCPSTYNDLQLDYDNDGFGDLCDEDDDNDGVEDDFDNCQSGELNWSSSETNDYDSDGCLDSVEDDDDDSDGVIDSVDNCQKGEIGWQSSSELDHDSDGCKDESEDSDDDNDSYPDGDDSCPSGLIGWAVSNISDYDSDGCEDSTEDDDNDNDGVQNLNDECPVGELGWFSNYSLDFDSDGCKDQTEDNDDDNDQILDSDDACPLGVINWHPTSESDYDSDGCLDDNEDDDDDSDGINDSNDKCPKGIKKWFPSVANDHDSDGCHDEFEDLDDDNDNIQDSEDTCNKGHSNWASNNSSDLDKDGCHDLLEDFDDDSDGIFDVDDSCSIFVENWVSTNSTDYDTDGCHDEFHDADDDNDGIDDEDDLCPQGAIGWSITDAEERFDYDSDGCNDLIEDDDDDNDGVLDVNDALPLDASESVDTDGDGIGDNADSDDDNDGVLDSEDDFPLDDTEWVDTDSDGTGNNADTDDDDDLVLDVDDAFPLDATEWADVNNDGFGDNKNPLSAFDNFKQAPALPLIGMILVLGVVFMLYRAKAPSLKQEEKTLAEVPSEEE